jgi:hypothetical protein
LELKFFFFSYCVGDELGSVLEVGENLAVNAKDGNLKGVFLSNYLHQSTP